MSEEKARTIKKKKNIHGFIRNRLLYGIDIFSKAEECDFTTFFHFQQHNTIFGVRFDDSFKGIIVV